MQTQADVWSFPRAVQTPIFATQTNNNMKTYFKHIFAVVAVAVLGLSSISAACNPDAKNKKTMKAIELNDAQFKAQIYDYEKNPNEFVFEGELPAIVDFFATWCGPCKMMAPVMNQLSEEYAGKLNVYKVDVDKEQGLAAIFGVRSIPTFVLIPKSGKPQILTGGMGIEAMRKIINENLIK